MSHILNDSNEHAYVELIMCNLKTLLECPKIEINEFFERTITEVKSKDGEGFCNLETSFKNKQLPEFSDKSNEYLKMAKLNDYNLWVEEIEEKIRDRDKKKDDVKNKKKSYEIEHSYIDFQMLIIGEKIRASEENFEFNDFKLCNLIKPNSDDLEFYKGQTI